MEMINFFQYCYSYIGSNSYLFIFDLAAKGKC